jgi:ribosomal protein S18 acetylase RimI-like enzyme
MGMTVQLGLPEHLRAQAAALYWQAFGQKLGRVMGPDARALRFLHRVIRADHAIVALEDGQLLGLVGFKTPHAAFAGGGFGDMWAVYGVGALWRAALLRLLERDVDNARFLMDGLCVSEGARGRGVGTALLAAITDEARVRGYGAVRLDVIDTNPRARALYERQGFVAVRTAGLGVLRHVFGFDSATTMVRGV